MKEILISETVWLLGKIRAFEEIKNTYTYTYAIRMIHRNCKKWNCFSIHQQRLNSHRYMYVHAYKRFFTV